MPRKTLSHFKLPPKIIFTKDGLDAVVKEKEELLLKRPGVVKDLSKAREMGDLSENGAYKAAKMELGRIDARLRHLSHLIRFAQVKEKSDSDKIDINSSIVISDGTTTRTLVIVGEHEASPLEGKISHRSPLGKALLGKTTNESVLIETPKGSITYTIVSFF
ncbi:MAG TPA: transcription elongation factor GreA [Patescibacteria group bacterium]|nr:transcription elongation factor GreA [Patescibacteria group bacterium]